jgi:N-acetylneuraminic acid mutarotase
MPERHGRKRNENATTPECWLPPLSGAGQLKIHAWEKLLMKRAMRLLPAVAVIGFLIVGAQPAQAAPITIQFSAEVAVVDDFSDLLGGAISVGNTITGEYTYESTTMDSNPLSAVGDYWHTTAPYGISVNAGGFVFSTDPANVGFLVEIVNDDLSPGFATDQYLLRSYNNLPLSNGIPVGHIAWQLDDPTATALTSDALPTSLPVLTDWQSLFGLTLEGGTSQFPGASYFIRAHVTNVAVRPAPVLESIEVTPPDATISVGQTQQFSATGTFSDGSTRILGHLGGGSGTWLTKAPMPTARYGLAGGVINGVFYVVGGRSDAGTGAGTVLQTLEAYDSAGNTWTAKAPMPTARQLFGAGVVNGVLYAVGGEDAGGRYLNTVEAYDPQIDTWSTKAPMPTPREHLGVGVVNGILYAVGGFDNSSTSWLNTVEAYDPLTDTWTTKAPMPTGTAALAVVVIDNILYAVGGNDSRVFANLYAYDPATDLWTTRASMPTARWGLSAGALHGLLYAIGGFNSDLNPTGLATVEVFDPLSNTWSVESPLSQGRHVAAAGVMNGALHVVGGVGIDCCTVLSSMESFTPSAHPEVTWSSGQPGVASIESTGLATALSPGATTITATLGSISGSAELTVARPVPIASTRPDVVTYGITPSRSVTVFGSQFAPGAQITVGPLSGATVRGEVATPTTPFVFTNRRQVKFYWPNTSLASGVYDVQVTNPDGRSGILVGGFTVSAPQPVVSSVRRTPVTYGITPSKGMTIRGSHFVLGATVAVGSLTGTTVSGTRATAATPFVHVDSQHLKFYWHNTSLPPGSYDVTVSNPAAAGGLTGSLPHGFVVTGDAPGPPYTFVWPGSPSTPVDHPPGADPVLVFP